MAEKVSKFQIPKLSFVIKKSQSNITYHINLHLHNLRPIQNTSKYVKFSILRIFDNMPSATK